MYINILCFHSHVFFFFFGIENKNENKKQIQRSFSLMCTLENRKRNTLYFQRNRHRVPIHHTVTIHMIRF